MSSRSSDTREKLAPFRSDLVIVPLAGPQRTLHRVADPQTQVEFELDDLEYRIARLFDGERSAEEVSEAAARIGFHVSPRHVGAFHRELSGLGFVGASPTPEIHHPPADHRQDITTFMAQARAYLAQGRPDLAQGLFEAVLQLDPQHVEAQTGLKQVRSRSTSRGPSGGGDPSRSRWRGIAATVLGVTSVAVAGWFFVASGVWSRGSWASVPAPPQPEAAAVGATVRPDTRGSTDIAVPHTTEDELVKEALSIAGMVVRRQRFEDELLAPDDGVITDVRVGVDDTAGRGDVILIIEPKNRDLDREVDRLRKRVVELKELAAQSKAYEPFLDTARRRLLRARKRALSRSSIEVTSSVPGVVVMSPEEGTDVGEGEVVARVVSPILTLTAHLRSDGMQPIQDPRCSVEDSNSIVFSCRITRLDTSGPVWVTEVEVDDAPLQWSKDVPLKVTIREGQDGPPALPQAQRSRDATRIGPVDAPTHSTP